MVLLAAGDLRLPATAPQPRGASIQVRLYAEDPAKNFQPSSGLLTEVRFPEGVRVETWVTTGTEVPALLRPDGGQDHRARRRPRRRRGDKLIAALDATRVYGIETNRAYLRQILDATVFRAGRQTTRYLEQLRLPPRTFDVLEAGVQTSVQDWPGRTGYWDVGVPPSGPMDDLRPAPRQPPGGQPEGAAGWNAP
jgi:urea carboxylase